MGFCNILQECCYSCITITFLCVIITYFKRENLYISVPLTAFPPYIFEQGAPHFHFVVGTANHVTNSNWVERMEGGRIGSEYFDV